MSDKRKDPSLDEFIRDFNQQLDQVILKNSQNLSNLLDRNDPMVNRTITGVYNDFFGKGSAGNTPAGNTPAGNVPAGNIPMSSAPDQTVGAVPEGTAAVSTGETSVTPAVPEKSGAEQLQELTGLQNIKHDVAELVALAKVRKMREEKGLKFVPTSLHLVFAGNPGTGKTTVARILAQLYKEIGILSKGQLVEVDRSGLVAGFVGQTAIKTQEKINEAMGGVLFIDEAYSLVRKEGNDFGQEAIDTILKAMEDHRDEFIVIVAGYTDLMEEFIESNPGLKSRFNKYFYFQDYTAEELMTIFESNCRKYSYTITDEAKAAVKKQIEDKVENKDENFANAREVRNLFEKIITNQATRVAEMTEPTEEDLTTILPEDLVDKEDQMDPAYWEEEEKKAMEGKAEETAAESSDEAVEESAEEE